jgi:hypothetical protein
MFNTYGALPKALHVMHICLLYLRPRQVVLHTATCVTLYARCRDVFNAPWLDASFAQESTAVTLPASSVLLVQGNRRQRAG